MPVEVQKFRAAIGTWLLAITGMAAHVGTRVFSGWPMQPPTYPMITFGLRRSPGTDYPAHSWTGTLTLELYADNEDTLDAIEDLVSDWLARNAAETTLSVASNVLCAHFALTGVARDVPVADMEADAYVAIMRAMSYDFTIVGLET